MEPVILPQCETGLHTRKQALTKLKALYGKGYRYVVRDKDSAYLYCYSLKPKKFQDLQGWGYENPDGPDVLPAFPIKNVDLVEIRWGNRSAVMIERVVREGKSVRIITGSLLNHKL
ncbi:DNA topoisomerase [Solibacillus sp. FSL H8-0523]|uniref:DNA topoisomerase n=1 Tax=Solibacillus sp. FSL H8-0523 TaxID=2954511 RepID=UPI0031014EC1